MEKERAHIIATLWGVPQGYIKSISYKHGTFKLAKEKIDAKGYTNIDKIHGDIDFLAKYHGHMGYVFIYD